MSLLSFLNEYLGVIIFYSLIVIIVYLNKKRFQKDGLAYLLKTKLGLKWMDSLSKKHRKAVKTYGYIGIVFAYIGFFFFLYLLFPLVKDIIVGKPGVAGAGPALPGFEIPGTGIKIPLIIGWIALLIIMIVHEFSHGVVAKAHKQEVKSSGIGVVGPLPVAFVELDEKALGKEKHKIQHSVFAAGPFANFILTAVCIVLLLGVSYADATITTNEGVIIGLMQNKSLPAPSAGLPNQFILTGIDNQNITNVAKLNFILENIEPYQNITIHTNEGSYNLTTTTHPNNKSKSYLGILVYGDKIIPNKEIYNPLHKLFLWLAEFFWWTGFLSINIGLFNLFPIFITDGAKMLKLNIDALVKNKEKSLKIWKYINFAGLFILGILLIQFFTGIVTGIFNFLVSLF